jgi:tubulin polyglutamylase TTLL4
MYILKPTASSCGRGIRVIGKKQSVNKRPGYLISKYLSKPHLLRGYKYDMRIYVLVTCFEPLKAYIFTQGLVRLATVPYSTGKGSLKKRFIHLTNFSVNKKSETYVKNTGGADKPKTEEDEMSFKWSFDQLRAEYKKMGIDSDEVFKNIRLLIIKTLMAVEPQITTAMRTTKHRNQCFEVYGFDVIIDAKLRPWLLEVNVCPSLSSSSPYDKQVKTLLLCDTLHLVGYRLFDRKRIDDDKKKENKQRLLGFESKNKQPKSTQDFDDLGETPKLSLKH